MDIEKTFTTGTPADKMKDIIVNTILPRSDVQMFFGDTSWEGNTLKFSSGLVTDGKFEILDNEVKVTVALSMFGKMAKGQIESTLEKTFAKLPG
ncbi:MAG: polyhydroxyalkanoic acid system family protein [Bacteroidota bacterium]|nr:polyhydroxyalkanoic acid system family protein [Bacteroidota bacterium]